MMKDSRSLSLYMVSAEARCILASHSSACVAHYDAPLNGERAATRGRSVIECSP